MALSVCYSLFCARSCAKLWWQLLAAARCLTRSKLGWYWPRSMTLGRFAVLFFIGLVAATALKLIWLYLLLAAALLAVLVKLRLNG